MAADINAPNLVATSAFADYSEKVPLASDTGFVVHLRQLLSAQQVDTYCPVIDEEIVLAADLMEQGHLEGVQHLMAPSAATARRCLDKFECAKWLQEAALPHPETVLLSQGLDSLGFPCFAKPRWGRGSIGARQLDSIGQWDLSLEKSAEALVIQECCEGPEITVDVLIDRPQALMRAVARERIEVKAGVCTKARVFESPEFTDLAFRLAELLDFDGIFCFQVMRSKRNDEWLITDVNPRPGAGTRMTVAAGVNLLAAAFAARWGEDALPLVPALEGERFVVRQYVEYVFRP